MRKILFKAKRLDNGEWVEGDLIHSFDGENRFAISNAAGLYEIVPYTICQYTGLTDKNGNKIWENDVVRKSDTNALGWGRVRNCKISFDKLGYWLLTTQYGDGYWLGEWIPVEERLPEEEGTYLCYEVYGNYPNYGVLNFAKNLHKVDKYDFKNEKRPGFYHLDSEYGYIEDTNVAAWMPLPAPYDMRKKVEE